MKYFSLTLYQQFETVWSLEIILLKTLWEKEKMLVTSIFSFVHNVFYFCHNKFKFFINIYVVFLQTLSM